MNLRLAERTNGLLQEPKGKLRQRPTYDEYFESRLSGYRKQIDRIDEKIFKFIVLRRRKFVRMAPSARDALYHAAKNIEEGETIKRVKNAAQKISLPHEYMENIANILHGIIKLCGWFEAKGKIEDEMGELFKLILKRATIAVKIGKLKKDANLPIENSERETEIIERLKPAAKKAALSEEDVESIWREIFAFCKKIQIEKK